MTAGGYAVDIHYYLLCYRFEALVASHLDPVAFGRYMAVGTEKLSRGHVLFAEIDPDLRSSYFRLDDIRERCVPKPDGSPKCSKYISVYRVLEHLDLSVIGMLYMTTVDGRVLGLTGFPYGPDKSPFEVHLYQELCPVSPLVVSGLAPARFCRFMTDPANPVSVPRLFFADLQLERDKTGDLAGYLPYDEPTHILRCMDEVERGQGKTTKTVDRTPGDRAFFRTIGLGFFVGDQKGLKYYPFPALRDLEVKYNQWWRSACAN
ncbi:MAG: hypothetical protein ABFE01_28970 [Phycisphaerales bacterium]